MLWLLLEALAALALLAGLVWWTMFAGRRRGERAEPGHPATDDPPPEEGQRPPPPG